MSLLSLHDRIFVAGHRANFCTWAPAGTCASRSWLKRWQTRIPLAEGLVSTVEAFCRQT
jgi:hypothetical protein